MSQTQVNLPALSDEESTVVEHFIERSREIAPTVEVTLAKRILRPGSNRVVCLAARTSVPLNDEDTASVSDLALRLSDGTNVVLSLSFFNDTTAGDFIPFTPYSFNPNRYSMHSDSKLGMVLLAICMVGSAAVYSMSNGPLSKYMQAKPIVKAMATGAGGSLLKCIPVNPSLVKPAAVSAAALVPKLPPVNFGRTAPKAVISGNGENSRVRSKVKRSGTRSRNSSSMPAPNEEMLVPPPPATYVPPYGYPVQIYDQIPTFNFEPRAFKPAPANQPKATRQAKSEINQAPKAESNTYLVNPNKSVEKPVEPMPKAKREIAPSARTQPVQEINQDYSQKSGIVEPRFERISLPDAKSSTSAPLPGNPASGDSLERIVPPHS